MMKSTMKKGFTLLELLISLSIFVFMTAFLLAKYGTFNQSIILTDLAYDVAITVRNAQAQALNVQGDSNGNFNNVYGVHFDPSTANSFIYFVNVNSAPVGDPAPTPVTYNASFESQKLSVYTMKAGDTISQICVGGPTCNPLSEGDSLDIVFQRPNPDAKIYDVQQGGAKTQYFYAGIKIKGIDGSTRDVIVQGTGEISVNN